MALKVRGFLSLIFSALGKRGFPRLLHWGLAIQTLKSWIVVCSITVSTIALASSSGAHDRQRAKAIVVLTLHFLRFEAATRLRPMGPPARVGLFAVRVSRSRATLSPPDVLIQLTSSGTG